jgi:glycosyltransferase involved in cell wall biosynthesis
VSSSKPLVSLVLCVKDGIPYLPDAVESVRAQTYERIEFVVQDGVSRDGSLEYLQALDAIDLVSEADSGIGDAFNRAFARCRGEIVGSVDSDNRLDPDAVAAAVDEITSHGDCAAVYGSVELVDTEDSVVMEFVPGEFDLLRLIACELVPPFSTAFFSRMVCGDELHFDRTMATCADYDLWLRLSHLPVRRIDTVLGSTRLSDKSMTRDVSRYGRFVSDKLGALERYLSRYPRSPLVDAIGRAGVVGINLWAAESIVGIDAASRAFEPFLAAAEALDPGSPRLARFRERLAAIELEAPIEAASPVDESTDGARPSRAPWRRLASFRRSPR